MKWGYSGGEGGGESGKSLVGKRGERKRKARDKKLESNRWGWILDVKNYGSSLFELTKY